MWTLEEGVGFCQQLEVALGGAFHTALAGSVLNKGSSEKDLDVIVYPHGSTSCKAPGIMHVVQSIVKFESVKHLGNEDYETNGKTVYGCWTNSGRRVDIIIMDCGAEK